MRKLICILAACFALAQAETGFAQALYLAGYGPVTRSMGGAATAAPLEAAGAIYWNPASIGALPGSELQAGVDLLLPSLTTESRVGQNSGSTDAEPGVIPLPEIGWVHNDPNSMFTLGLGINTVGGFATNYPASTTNPVFLPPSDSADVPGGIGRVYSSAQFVHIIPTLAMQVSEKLAIGIAPIAAMGSVVVDPFVFTAPNDANGNGVSTFPSGQGTRFHWGGGVQAGLYYQANEDLSLGFAIRSPVWFETFHYKTEDELGRPKSAKLRADLPMVLSLGTGYRGFEKVVLAADVRFYDFKNAPGFSQHGFRSDGSLAGLGWSSILAVALGAQYQLNDSMSARVGYTFNQSPTRNGEAGLNVSSPLYYQHQLSVGFTNWLTAQVGLSLAYTHAFEASRTGPLLSADGVVPDSSLTLRESADFLTTSITVRY